MSAIGPGDWVECVDNSAHGSARGPVPCDLDVGAIYQVSSCHRHPHDGTPTVCLCGGRLFGEARWHLGGVTKFAGYGLHRFRPIYRPKSEIIQGLLTPIHETEDAA